MGKTKKSRTALFAFNSNMIQDLSRLDSFIFREQKKKFDELIRCGMIVRDSLCQEWSFDDFNWITS